MGTIGLYQLINRYTCSASTVVILFVAVCCSNNTRERDEGSQQGEQNDDTTAKIERKVQALAPELEPVVRGNNEFAFSLYRQLINPEEAEQRNLFFSPFSVSAALAMTYAGASGTTAEEMRDVLAIQTDDDAFHNEFGTLVEDLSGDKPGRGYQLYVANGLFGDVNWNFYSEFLELNEQYYGAAVQSVDYCNDPEAARQTINQWVAVQTQDKINELFPVNAFDCLTKLNLVDAIYFKANWAEQFDPNDTANRPFQLLSGETVNVPTMSAKINIRTAETPNLTLLDIPYQDDELSMIILLPQTPDGLPALETSFELEQLEQLITSASEDKSLIELPRFELRSKPGVKQALMDMGMISAFDGNTADFSKMAPGALLFIGDVVHEAFVHVDEEGTEAASATDVEMKLKSAQMPIQIAHPFMFLIRDRLTRSILFMGRILDPRPASK